MASKNESYYTREICKNLERVGCKIDAIVGSRMNKSGRPDRYLCHLDWHGWFEAKKDGKPLSPYQKEWHIEQMKRQPGSVFIIDIHPNINTVYLGYYLPNTGKATRHFVFNLEALQTNKALARQFISCLHELACLLRNQRSDDKASSATGIPAN